MKIYLGMIWIFSMTWISVDGQCLPQSIAVCPAAEIVFAEVSPPSSSCQVQGNCNGLESGYLVVSYPDTLVLAGLDQNAFMASDFQGCISIVPVCYDLQAVKAFVDALHNNAICCSAVNAAIPDACDTIKALFPNGGADIQSIEDFTRILEAIAENEPTLREIVKAAELFNAQIGVLNLLCPGTSPIAFCLDSELDFSQLAYEITPDACGFADCVDTIRISSSFLTNDPHQFVFRATDAIFAQGTVTVSNAEDIEFRAGLEVTLQPEFQVENGAQLLIEIELCEITMRLPMSQSN